MSQSKNNDDEPINISNYKLTNKLTNKLTDKLTNKLTDKVLITIKKKILTTIKKKMQVEGIELNTKTVIKCLRYVMEVIEVSELKGEEQKIMAIKIMRDLVNETELDDNSKKIILSIVDNNILGNIIDFVVDATKGNVSINNIKDIGKSCCLSIFN